MLFTSPAFMFVYLPLSVVFCVIFGKNRKKLCLGVVSAIYYVLLYAESPVNMCWLLLLFLYAYFARRVSKLGRMKFIKCLLGCVPLVWLVLMRALSSVDSVAHAYPAGLTFPALCVSAYIWDTVNSEAKSAGAKELWLYITFFPLMLIGPFVTHDEFCQLTREEHMGITIERCSSGITLFVTGFIKRIAVGATLVEGYEKIFSYSWQSPNLIIILLLLVLIYFGVFFSVSGYYDMAVGICRMLGVDVLAQRSNPFSVATVNEYSCVLLVNIRRWLDKYIINPVMRGRNKLTVRMLGVIILCFCTLLLLRTDAVALTLMIPLMIFSLISAALHLDKSYKGGRSGLRALFGMLTVLVIGAFWVFVTMGSNTPLLLEYISSISSDSGEYQTDIVLISFSMLKYCTVAIMGLLLLLPQANLLKNKYEALGEKTQVVIDYGSLVLLLLMFLFTVVFFLPQYSYYNDKLFRYIML